MPRPLFSLSPRLKLCAVFVRNGRTVIDVGTDHAYLPIWLIKSGKTPRAVACDINMGPLEFARRHAAVYEVEDSLRLVQSDGLSALSPLDGDDIIIAGMGGELMLHIINSTPWLLNLDKRLILQPMSAQDKLRIGLRRKGYQVMAERACEDSGKVYSAFVAKYIGDLPNADVLYPYMGHLCPGDNAVKLYATKIAHELMKKLRGAEHTSDTQVAKELNTILKALKEKYSIDSGEK